MAKDKIVLFDLDGTLIDSTPAICESFHAAFRAFDKELPSEESIKKLIGHTLEDIFLSLGVEDTKCPQYVAAYKEHYQKICTQKTTLLQNAKESILKAHEFAYLGVVTTKTGLYSKVLLEHFGVLQFFHCVIGRENASEPKPSKEPILKALESMPKGIANSCTFMVGDTPLDILAANAAQIESFGVLSGYATLEVLQKYTDRIAKDSLEAVLAIEGL